MRTCWGHGRTACKARAMNGDYCFDHSLVVPHDPYAKAPPWRGRANLPREHQAQISIARMWRARGPARTQHTVGPYSRPAFYHLATNEEEFASLEPLTSIPTPYVFTFVDLQHKLWVFDIRSLAASPRNGTQLRNPYNRVTLEPTVVARYEARMLWLQRRSYCRILHSSGIALNPRQQWNQRILEVFLTLDTLGFVVNPAWFESLTPPQHMYFRYQLDDIWSRRVKPEDREAMCPGVTERTGGRLFTRRLWPGIGPDTTAGETLSVIERLTTASTDKNVRTLGALYTLAALTTVSEQAREAYPWLWPYRIQ
jgi:hypothetical protein